MESPRNHSRKVNRAATLPSGASLQQAHSFSHNSHSKDGIFKKIKRKFRFGSRGHYEFDELNDKSVVVKSFTRHNQNNSPPTPPLPLTPDSGRLMVKQGNPNDKLSNGEGDRHQNLNNIPENSPKMSTQRPQSVQEGRRKWEHHYEQVKPKSFSSSSKLSNSRNSACNSEGAKSFLSAENTIYFDNSYVIQDSKAIDLDDNAFEDEPGYESLDDVRNKVQQLRCNSLKEKVAPGHQLEIVCQNSSTDIVTNGVHFTTGASYNGEIDSRDVDHHTGGRDDLSNSPQLSHSNHNKDLSVNGLSEHNASLFKEDKVMQNSQKDEIVEAKSGTLLNYFKSDEFDPYENPDDLDLPSRRVSKPFVEHALSLEHSNAFDTNISTQVADKSFNSRFWTSEIDPYQNPDDLEREMNKPSVEHALSLEHSSAFDSNTSTQTADNSFDRKYWASEIDPYQNPDDLEIPTRNVQTTSDFSTNAPSITVDEILSAQKENVTDVYASPQQVLIKKHSMKESKKTFNSVSLNASFGSGKSGSAEDCKSTSSDMDDSGVENKMELLCSAVLDNESVAPPLPERNYSEEEDDFDKRFKLPRLRKRVNEYNEIVFPSDSEENEPSPPSPVVSSNEARVNDMVDTSTAISDGNNFQEIDDTDICPKFNHSKRHLDDYDEVILPSRSERIHSSLPSQTISVTQTGDEVVDSSSVVCCDQKVSDKFMTGNNSHFDTNDSNSNLTIYPSSSLDHNDHDLVQALDQDTFDHRLRISNHDNHIKVPFMDALQANPQNVNLRSPAADSQSQNKHSPDCDNPVSEVPVHEPELEHPQQITPQQLHSKNEPIPNQDNLFQNLMADLLQGNRANSNVSELTENTLAPYNPFGSQDNRAFVSSPSKTVEATSTPLKHTESGNIIHEPDDVIPKTSIPKVSADLHNVTNESRIIPELSKNVHEHSQEQDVGATDKETGIGISPGIPSVCRIDYSEDDMDQTHVCDIQQIPCDHVAVSSLHGTEEGATTVFPTLHSTQDITFPTVLPSYDSKELNSGVNTLQNYDNIESSLLLSPVTSSSGGSDTVQSDSLTLSLTSSGTGVSLNSPSSPAKVATHEQSDSQENSMILCPSDSLDNSAVGLPPSQTVHDGTMMFDDDLEDEPIHMTLDEVRRQIQTSISDDRDLAPPPILPPRRPRRSTDRADSGSKGKDFLESMQQLKECGWYWGPISWDEANQLLAYKPDGSFLVRDSSDPHYILSLSFRHQGNTAHTRIEHHKGMFSFFSQPTSHGRNTIKEFIDQTVENSKTGKFCYFVRPNGPGLPPMPVHITHPVSRFCKIQSLQHMCRFNILKLTRRDHIENLPLPKKIQNYLKDSQYYVENIDDS